MKLAQPQCLECFGLDNPKFRNACLGNTFYFNHIFFLLLFYIFSDSVVVVVVFPPRVKMANDLLKTLV